MEALSAEGLRHMAADLTLLERAEAGVSGFRVYGWNSVWVTLGRFQHAEEVVMSGAQWAQRPTGGSAVLHGHDVTVALAFPLVVLPGAEGPRGLKQIYRAAIGPLVAAMNACGLPAVLAEERQASLRKSVSPDCFAATSSNDIVNPDSGQKVCGCALRVTRRAVLVQASIPYQRPSSDPGLFIKGAVSQEPRAWNYESMSSVLGSFL